MKSIIQITRQSEATGIEANLAADKEAYLALVEQLVVVPTKTVDKGIDLLHIHRYIEYREADIFMSGTTSITYKDGETIIQESMGEEFDYDPSEGGNWNWVDYE